MAMILDGSSKAPMQWEKVFAAVQKPDCICNVVKLSRVHEMYIRFVCRIAAVIS